MPNFHNIKNNAQAILTADINNTSNTININIDSFPAVPFYITIDDEILEVTAKNALILTVNRGVDNTTAAPHNKDSKVELRVVADIIRELQSGINQAFQSASDGKTLVASAITGKGVATNAADTFSTMATNISNISGLKAGDTIDASKIQLPVFPQKVLSLTPLATTITDDNNYIIGWYSSINKYDSNFNLIWSCAFTSGTPYSINKVSDGYIVGADGSVTKISLSGVKLWSTSITGTLYSGAIDTDCYVFGSSNSYLYKTDLSGTKIGTGFNLALGYVYCIYIEADGYVCGTSTGHLAKVSKDFTTKIWDYNVGHSEIWSIYRETDGYVCGSTAGNLTKISLDGITKIFDKLITTAGNTKMRKIYREVDGYVFTSGSQFCKVSLDGTTILLNITTKSGNISYFERVGDYYIAVGLNYITKISLDGRIMWCLDLGTSLSVTLYNNTSAYRFYILNDSYMFAAGNFLIKVPFNPQFTYLG